MQAKLDEKMRGYIQQARRTPSEIITEAHLSALPEPMQRYLRYARVIGRPKVKCIKVRQKGLMRTSPTQPWMPVEALQYSTLVEPLSRTWYAKIKIGPLSLLSGYDRYDQGAGRMVIRLLSMYPVADASGPEVDMSALIVFINDMVMWPTAFLSDYIHWEAVDASTARMRVSLHGKQFSAELHFNAAGEMVDFITEQRYRSVGKAFKQDRWSTPFRLYREANGLRIPSEGEAVWHLPEGEFPYIQVKIGEVQYDDFDLA
jgi:hypothetical protein